MARRKTTPAPRLRLQIEHGTAFGPGKATLLEPIAATGSISEAGKVMDMSCRTAWALVASMNADFRAPLVARSKAPQEKPGEESVMSLLKSLARRAARAAALAAVLAAAAAPARAGEVLVAVAANFAEAVEQLRPGFERATGHRLVATTGSTGKLYAQIRAGAPFQVLLAADAKTPALLEAEGAAVAGTRFTYAIGRLVLWSRAPGVVAGDGARTLREGRFRHLAIANPDLAPYGVAAREVLQATGTWDALRPRIVMGQNIGHAHALVASGAAELGFVALSALKDPRAPAGGSAWEVPASLHAPLQQDAVLLNPGRGRPAATALLAYLRSPAARAVIEAQGYGVE